MEISPLTKEDKRQRMHVMRGTAPHLYEVGSETEPGRFYQVFCDGTIIKCSCRGYITHKTCKHLEMVQEYVRDSEGGVEPEEQEETEESLPAAPGLSRWMKKIHGKDCITYEGLLAMAHEHGLQQLGAEFVLVTDTLATAIAWAQFWDGRVFWEAGDATPDNVNANVKAHFPRVALTRAKARCLRDALNIGMVAVEELAE